MASNWGDSVSGSGRARTFALVICVLMVLSAAPTMITSLARAGNATLEPTAIPVAAPEFMNYIHVNNFSFDPLLRMPVIPDSLSFSSIFALEQAYYIVQLKGPVTEDMKHALGATGVSVLQYISYNAFVVRGDGASIAKAKSLWCARWVGVFEPGFKISPRLSSDFDKLLETIKASSDTSNSSAPVTYISGGLSNAAVEQTGRFDPSSLTERSSAGTAATNPAGRFSANVNRAGSSVASASPTTITVEVLTFEKSRVLEVADALSRQGATGIVYSTAGDGQLRATIDRGEEQALAHEMGVMLIDRYVQPTVTNDIARWVVQSNDQLNYSTPVHDNGIWGTGQTVTIADTGLDYHHAAFADPVNYTPGPNNRKVTAYYVPSDAGGDFSDEGIDHGTHTSGTVAGDDGTWHVYDGDPFASSGSTGPHDGQAFDAKIQMQDISTDGNYVYPPTNIADMYSEAASRGSYIHTNSWGSVGAAYTPEAMSTDQFIWDNQDFLVLYAAGNPGSGLGMISPFSTAKNVISVGATLNGAMSDEMASFSGRGPASDGRIKPDVTAPGVGIWSAQGGSGDSTYWQLSGTSMATPCIAGSAALVRQYFMDGFYPTGSKVSANGFTPSAALMKAVLINGADEMTGTGAYENGQFFYPNDNQGWGRINLDNALYFAGDSRGLVAVDDRSGLSTGATATYQLAIGSGDQPVEITLVWSDYPGLAQSDPNLVNDLDLTVHAPDGTVYRGNQYIGYSPAESKTNPASNDHINNVEGVLAISGVQPGVWTVSVSGYNVPMGPQPFALIMTGAIATQKGTIQMDKGMYQSSATVNITVVDTGLNLDPNATDTATMEMSSSTETAPELVVLTETAISSSVFRGWIRLNNSATPVSDGLLQVQNGDLIIAAYFDANDGLGGSGYVYDYAGVDDSPPLIYGVQTTNLRFSRATVEWVTDEPADSVVYWGTTTPLTSTARNERLSYNHAISLTGLAENTTYYFAVQSTDEAGNIAYDDNGASYYWFTTPVRPPIAPLSDEWPTFHNNEPRQGVSPSNFLPPVQQMWSNGPHTMSRWSGPVLSDGLLYVTSMDGYVRAREPTSGDVVWERNLGEPYYYACSPTVANGIVYVTMAGSNNSAVYALDGLTGDTIWASDSNFYSARNVMSYADGLVFVAAGNDIIALDALTGTVAWDYFTWDYPIGGATVTGGVLYQAVLDYSTEASSLIALDENSGAFLWSRILDNIAVGPPLYAQGNVYIGTYFGTMYALDAVDGSVVWTYSDSSTIDFGTPAYDGAAIYYCDMAGNMFALDATDGSLIWRTGVGYGSSSAPAYANGYLYITSFDGNLYTVDSFDGTVVDSDYIGPGSTSSPAVSDGWIWVEANDGTVAGFLGQLPVGMILKPLRHAMDAVPDSQAVYNLSLTNVGHLGPDTFDATVSLGGPGWTTQLFASDGVTPLSDSDGDGLPDTGALLTWETADIVVKVTVPAGALAGDSASAMITFNSSTDKSVSKTAVVVTTVPLPGVKIGPSAYMAASAGDVLLGLLKVQNLGGFPDTMDINSSDSAGWNYTLVQSDGVTPLADTDGDGIPDTGVLPGLGSVLIGVIVDVPMSAPEGSVERIIVRAASSLDPSQVDSAAVIAEIAPPPNIEWPTHHNNNARTGVSPSQFSPPLVLQWGQNGTGLRAQLAGPVMADGILFSTSEDGYIRARDPYTGQVLWARMLGDEYYYTGTPAVDGGVVYVTFYGYSGGNVYALDEFTGNTIWSVGMSSGLDFNARVQMAASDGLVYGTTWNGYVYALSESDGSVVWSYNTGGRPYGGVAIGGGWAFIGSLEGYLYAFDKDTGALQWSTLLGQGEITSAPLYAQGNLYVGTDMGWMFAVDAVSGDIVWHAVMGAPITFSTPAYNGNAIYFGTLGNMFYALDPMDGSVIWSTPVNDWVQCSPAFANGYLYATVWDGELVAFNATYGTIVYSQNIGSYSFTTSPAVSDGWVWVDDYDGSVFGLQGLMPYGVRVVPATQSQEVYPPLAVDFRIKVTNIGTFGPDAFNINLTAGVHGWSAQLYKADGVTPLPDTDGDSVPDTGRLATGANATIVVRVYVPGTAAAGDTEKTALTFTSSNNPTISSDASVVCEVPPPGVKIGPNAYVAVTQGTTARANMTVTNTGGFGDTIDIVPTSTHGWSVSLFHADGVTPLVDTNGDLVPDTGPIGGGGSLPIVIKVEVPADVLNGTLDRTIILATSSVDPSAIDEATMQCEVSPESAVDWPQFQHDAARTGVSSIDVSLPFVEKWRAQPFYSFPSWYGPVIHAGTVFYSTEAGYMLALDLQTGAVKWKTQLGIGYNVPSGPTVAYGNVYVAFASNWSQAPILYCLDEDTGAVIWSANAYSQGGYLYTSVVAAQGMVFWHDDQGHTLYANDAFTGKVLWTYVMDGEPGEGPAYWGGMVFLSDYTGKVVAVDASTGEVDWSAHVGSPVGAPLSISQGVLYFGDSSGRVHALDALTGEVIWTTSLGWSMDFASPVVAEGLVYIGTGSQPDGTMYALNEYTGSIVWIAYAQGAPIYSSAEYSNGIVFGSNDNGHLYAWNALTGALLQDQVVSQGSYMSSAALANGYIVVCDMNGGVTAYGFSGAGQVDHVSVTPASSDLGVMRTTVFEAHAYDLYGNEVAGAELTWRSMNGLGSVIPVSDDGTRALYIAGQEAGHDTVRVTSTGLFAEATVNILAGPAEGVSVSPASTSVVVGGAVQFSAHVEDMYGNTVPGAAISWSVDGGIGAISGTGLFTAGLVSGTGTVEASSGGMVGTAAVAVLPGVLDSIIITPDEFSLRVGEITVLHAQGYDASGNEIPGLSYVWSYTVGSVTPVSAEGAYAVFSAGLTTGTGTVSAACGGLTASAVADVLPGTVSRIVLSPARASVVAGATQAFTATTLDVFGNEISGAALTWSADSEIGTITQAGVLTASTVAGSGAVSVSAGSVSASASVTILPGTATLIVVPGGLSAEAGTMVTLEAITADPYGNVVRGLTYTWNCTIGSVSISVDSSHAVFVAGNHAGSGTVTVTDGSRSITLSANVTAGPLAYIVVEPSVMSLNAGRNASLTAKGYDAFGNEVSGLTFVWTLSDTKLGDIVTHGTDGASAKFEASGSGSGTITVSSGGVSAHVGLLITEKAGTLAKAAPTLALIAIIMAVAVVILVILSLLRSRGARPV